MTAANDGGDFLRSLRERAAARKRVVVYPEGDDPRILEAAAACVRQELVAPMLLGDQDRIRDGLSERGVDPAGVRVSSPDTEAARTRCLAHVRARRAHKNDSEEELYSMAADPLFQAATMVAEGEADGMVAGCVRTTGDVVRAGLVCVGLAPGIETLSSSFYMVFEPGHPVGARVLTFTDAGVVPGPSSDQLAEIAAAAVVARARIVGDDPRVAFLSYST
ncbi:MAG: phosphate acetyltransferase, partial [Gemmatimonadetes bacterium]|nr:phosphate acetyltransferase [Gemmatimonadota bacterium]